MFDLSDEIIATEGILLPYTPCGQRLSLLPTQLSKYQWREVVLIVVCTWAELGEVCELPTESSLIDHYTNFRDFTTVGRSQECFIFKTMRLKFFQIHHLSIVIPLVDIVPVIFFCFVLKYGVINLWGMLFFCKLELLRQKYRYSGITFGWWNLSQQGDFTSLLYLGKG